MSSGDGLSLNPEQESADGKGNTVPARVLIVDDTKPLRDVVAIVARRSGLEVCAEAADGRAGVEAARVHQPDAIVLDQEMPVLDGVSALPLLREAAPGALIVMFSSSDDAAVISSAFEGGAAAYFRKGVDSVDEVVSFLCGRLKGAA